MPTNLIQPSSDPHLLPRDSRGFDSADEVDPELLGLPASPKGERRLTVALLVVVGLTASAMACSLSTEAAYALAPTVEDDLGELYNVNPAALVDNRFVEAHGVLGGALAVRFERPFERDTYRVAPVMGRRDLWVEARVPAGEEGSRYVPPTTFRGRLVRWRSSGLRHRGLEAAVNMLHGEAIPKDAWLLIDEESPARARWSLVLAAMLAAFAAWSVAMIVRFVRPAR